MEQLMIYIWGIIAFVMIILELVGTGIFEVWFAIGAAAAAVVAWFFPANYALQIWTFIIVSGVLLIIGTIKFYKHDSNATPNPVYSIIGKEGVVTKPIDNVSGTGQIMVKGDTWSAKSANGENIPEGTKVNVLEIDGVKAVVQIIN
jgi:membrane protein implicated in regulation of membrane protease activity